jgi:hypothetical protein
VSTGPVYPSLHLDRAGLIRPDLIPLAAFLCAEEYDDYARALILDHAAASAPLAGLTGPTPEGWVILEPCDLAGAEEALARGGPAPAVEEIPVPAPIAGGAPVTAEPAALVEVVDHEALAYRTWKTPEGDFLAEQMERLAQLIRWTGATTPQEHTDRMEVWDDEIRDQAFEQGYHCAQDDALELRTFGPLGRPLDPTGRDPLR